MDDIFISYSRKDKAFAARLHEALQARQREAWVDLEDIPPTAEWRAKIKAGIEGARAFVFVLSPDSLASPECLNEVEHAAASHKRLIPVVCREVEAKAAPEALGRFNWISMREQDDFEKQLDILLTMIDTDLEWVDAHTSLLEKASEWDRKGRDQSLLLRGGELRKAEDWQVKSAEKEPKPTELMATFIVASRQGETRRQRYLLGGVSVGLVVALVLAALAFYQYRVADQRGKTAMSRQLAAQSSINLMTNKIDLAMLLSLAACQVQKTVEAKGALLMALQKYSKPFSLLQGHKDYVRQVAFSPNGKILASCSDDGTIILWDAETRRRLGSPLIGYEMLVTCLAFSPDGKILASGDHTGNIILWDVGGHRKLAPPFKTDYGLFQLAFSPDGKTLASYSGEKYGGTLFLWDVEKHLTLKLQRDILFPLSSLAFVRNGRVLAAGSYDTGEIKLFDAATLQSLAHPLRGHKDRVVSLSVSPDGRTLASGSRDKTIILWDVNRWQQSGTPLVGKEELLDIAFSPNGKILASRSEDKTILWDLEKRQPLGPPLPSLGGSGLAYSPDGKALAMGIGSDISLWEENALKPEEGFVGHEMAVRSLAFSSDGKVLASGSNDKTIRLWDMARQQPLGPPFVQKNMINSIALSPDGKTLASGGTDKTIMLWDVKSHKGLPLTAHKGWAMSVAFSPDRKLLASGSQDKTIILWDINKRQPLGQPLTGHKGCVKSVAFSPDGKLLATAGSQGTVILWDVGHRRPLERLTGHQGAVTCVVFSPDGKILASCGDDKSIILWEVDRRQALGPPLRGHKDFISSLAFSPDGETLASGSHDNPIILWDVKSRLQLGLPLNNHKGGVQSLAFSPDGKTLAAGYHDLGNIELWDMDFESWKAKARHMANRNLTREEWEGYMGDLPYQKTIPKLPEPEDEREAKLK